MSVLSDLVDGIIAGYQGVPARRGTDGRLQAVGLGIRHKPGCVEERPSVMMVPSGRRLHCPSCDAVGPAEVWVDR